MDVVKLLSKEDKWHALIGRFPHPECSSFGCAQIRNCTINMTMV